MFKRHLCVLGVLLSFMFLTGCGMPQSASQNTAIAGTQGPAGPPGLIFLNAYNASQQYVATDVVTYQGSSYVAIATSTGVAPVGAAASAADWAVLAQAGATGATGSQGAAGPQGVQGVPGPIGMTGAAGAAGATGAVGAQGAQGVQGPAGPVGITFQNTYSASQQYVPRDVVTYQGSSYLALAANTGVVPVGSPASSTNWIVLAQAGVAGATGAAGPQGLVGPAGPVGPTGAMGLQGIQGPQGVAGVQGPTGATGPAGAPGQAGAPGPQGVAGSQGPTGSTGAQGPAGPVGPAGPSVATYLQGRKLGVQGDSFSAIFNNAWQNVVTSRTGMTLTVQEAHPGKRFDTALECWSNPAVGGSPGIFTANHTLSGVAGTCAQNSSGIADGTAFADSLSNVDIQLIQLGTNDTSVPLGQLGDAANAGTFYGNMRWVVESYLNAKPTLRVVLVTLQYNGFTSAGNAQAYANAMVTYGNSIGVPVINMFTLGGVNAITAPVLLRDGVHPTDFDFANNFGPVIAQQLAQLY